MRRIRANRKMSGSLQEYSITDMLQEKCSEASFRICSSGIVVNNKESEAEFGGDSSVKIDGGFVAVVFAKVADVVF